MVSEGQDLSIAMAEDLLHLPESIKVWELCSWRSPRKLDGHTHRIVRDRLCFSMLRNGFTNEQPLHR